MKLEVGKCYKTREGELVRVLYIDETIESEYCCVTKFHNKFVHYLLNGKAFDKGGDHCWDIVSEFKEMIVFLAMNDTGVVGCYPKKPEGKFIAIKKVTIIEGEFDE